MRLLLAVLNDLVLFARTAIFGVFFENENDRATSRTFEQMPSPQLLLPLATSSIQEPYADTESEGTFNGSPGSAYFIGERDVSLYIDPVVAFDSVIAKLAYGDIVSVVKFGGRWAHIKIGSKEGWILKDMLREQLSDVFPVFQEGSTYEADAPETIKLRMCIDDAFNAGASGVPLTGVEYVTYTLLRKNVSIEWPDTRPRIAGTWQKIVRGKEGVHMGIIPKAGGVMEYIIDDQGHVCYVEAVFGDETIKIRGIGLLDEAVFSVLSMGKEEWKELRPVFIEVA
jgi:hypothetical protein